MAIELTDTNFKEIVLESGKSAVIDFWAPWCGPCKVIAPIMEELASELGEGVVVAKYNVDEGEEVPRKYGIRNIPTLLFFKDGELKEKIVGSTTKSAILSKLQSL
ncbi:MAG: thioredoxin [Bacteroidales bacterium]